MHKKIFFSALLACLMIGKSHAQVFVRIYDNQMKKIGAGTVESLTDTTIIIAGNEKQPRRYLITGIGMLKVKKIYTNAAGEPGTNNAGLSVTTGSGTGFGIIAGLLEGPAAIKSKLVINGDIERWKVLAAAYLDYGSVKQDRHTEAPVYSNKEAATDDCIDILN